MLDNQEIEGYSGPIPDEEKEADSPAEEDVGMTGEVSDVDPLLGNIVRFAIAVELYQKKNCNLFRCGSPDHLVKECPKELGKAKRKVGLNSKEGMVEKGGQSSHKLMVAQQATLDNAPLA